MNKNEIKNILISMRTSGNEARVNYLLGKIDMMEETEIEKILMDIGKTEENVRGFLRKKLEEGNQQDNKKFPINGMFTYGLSGNCIHLHLPADLHESLVKDGPSKTMAKVNLHLLDAIDRITALRNDGFHKFKDKNSIYMISPALIRPEIKFLNGLNFTTHMYTKRNLSDDAFVEEHPEAMLAVHIFGRDRNIGTALIGFDTINSPEWQAKKKQVIETLKNKGATIVSDSQKE